MMKQKNTLRMGRVLLLAACSLVLFGSCDKEDKDKPKEEPTENSAFPTPAYPQPENADAVLVAVKASAPSPVDMPSIPGMPGGDDGLVLDIGMGIALFKDNAQADKVLLNNEELKYENGVHIWKPDFTNMTNPGAMTGIDLSGKIAWQVTNPNINKTLNKLPGKPKITSGKSVDLSAGYTLTNDFATSAQKILYAIYSDNGEHVMKEKDAGSTSCTFTAQELANLSATENGIIQANAYIITDETIGGKKVYFVRQSTYSITNVTIK